MRTNKHSYFKLKALLRREFLGVLLLTSLIGGSFTAYIYFHLVPSYNQQLLSFAEIQSQSIADHLSHEVLENHWSGRLVISPDQGALLDTSAKKLGAYKIKVFAADGTVVHSTDPKDMGKVNTKPYFRDVVASGQVFSKVVTKGRPTLEGEVIQQSVAEVYVPMMLGTSFVGAYEVYHDLSSQYAGLNAMVFQSKLAVGGISGALGLLALTLGYLATRARLKKEHAELQLREFNANLELLVTEQTQEIRLTQAASVEALAMLAEHYDLDTGGHVQRIQRYVECLTQQLCSGSPMAEYLTRSGEYVKDISLASVLHDIGKTVVPRGILTKPAKLTPEEFEVVKRHTVVAGEILDRANTEFMATAGKDCYLALARDIALHHHERWDGRGYPHALAGASIPLSARIVAVADVYDALRSDRPYKTGWSHERAVETIRNDAGTAFDPMVVDAFLQVAEAFAATYRQHQADAAGEKSVA